MNIERNLTCKYCNKVYNEPITLPCGDSFCKQHINELLSIDDTNTFLCPFCNTESSNQNLAINKVIQSFIINELHKFELDPNIQVALNKFKSEIEKMEAILKNPENYIYEAINELKM